MEPGSSHKGSRITAYSVKFKLKVVQYSKDHGIRQAAAYFKVDRKRVREWRNQEDQLKRVENPSLRKKMKGGGRKVQYADIEEKVMDWLKRRRNAGCRVTGTGLKLEALRLHRDNGNQGFKASCGWLRCFKRRNKIVFRRATHVGQKSEEQLADPIQSFLRYVIRIRIRHKYELNAMINMDETPIWLDMPGTYTAEQKGAKSVNMISTGHEKSRVTIMLAAKADGTKLSPMVLFKGVRRPKVIPTGIVVKMTPNAWANEEVIKTWIRLVYGRENHHRRLLVWDALSSHRVPAVKQMLAQEYKSDVAMIPSGCTGKLQPCDVSWNRPFKDAFRDKYDAWLVDGSRSLTPKGNRRPPDRELLLQWIKETWDSVTPKVISYSFIKCGISSALDGTQDHLLGANFEEEDEEDPFEGYTEADVGAAVQFNEAINEELEAVIEIDALNEYSDEEEEDEEDDDGYNCPGSPGH